MIWKGRKLKVHISTQLRPRRQVSGYFRKRRFFSTYLKKILLHTDCIKIVIACPRKNDSNTLDFTYWACAGYKRMRPVISISRPRDQKKRRLCGREWHKPAKIKEFAAIFVWVLLRVSFIRFITVIYAIVHWILTLTSSYSKTFVFDRPHEYDKSTVWRAFSKTFAVFVAENAVYEWTGVEVWDRDARCPHIHLFYALIY